MKYLDKIAFVKAVTGLGWVPMTEEIGNLPVRPGKLYVFTDGTHYALGDSDKPEDMLKQKWFEPTHMALIDKPTELPKEVLPEHVSTHKQAILKLKEERCPDCQCRQYPACAEEIPCCMCDRETYATCNSKQPCEKKGGKQ